MNSIIKRGLALHVVLASLIFSCQTTTPVEKPLTIKEDPATVEAKAKEILASTAIQLAEGLTISLWASDSLAPDPIAMSIDDKGRVYLTSTERQKHSEFDIRGYRDWMTPSISFQSVEDRRAFLHKTFAPEKSKENSWLEDLNHDSIHDWRDLAVEKDEVWRLEDLSGDGHADISTRIVNDFNEEITDVAEGLLVRDKDMFIAIGPDLWRLQDLDGDGLYEKKESISTGYAVHIGFSGHGMSGIVEGPDGKIYWGIGDIGANITTKEGKNHFYPNEGIIVRSNPDGSDFEVFASGLRNTYEFVFDEYGNIITSDNDGDHAGESERLVHIVEGTDLGWRANWQYGKYTDPKNNGYNVWMDEKFYVPRWEGQAAHILPPIKNFHNGPTGMVYNPGTGLGSKWVNRFFLVEFVGTPSRSHIWSFNLKPKGASFDLNEDLDMVSGLLPTGIQFGPDGALYAADWVTGWGTKDFGRVWKIDVTGTSDLEAQRKETQKLMVMDYSKQNEETLSGLLANSDMRIRKKAQFELAKRGDKGFDVFKKTIAQRDNQLARIHGIWGIGQLAESNIEQASTLIDLLADADAEIIAQAAKVLGDRQYSKSGEKLILLLTNQNPRVKFYSAQALGRMSFAPAVQPLIQMIDSNNDEDLYLRHAGVVALSRIGQVEPMVALAKSPERDLRIAAALVLRRLKSEKISIFLSDQDEYIVTEAARAINDDLSIIKSLPDLAGVLNEKRFTSEPLLRRAINACLRVGGEREVDLLIAFAKRSDISGVLRGEALATLGSWPNPSLTDRVDGYYRGELKRDGAMVSKKVSENASQFLKEKNATVLIATSNMLRNLKLTDFNADLAKLAQTHSDAEVRGALINDLSQLKYATMEPLIQMGMSDKSEKVRATSIGLLTEINISKEKLPSIVKPIFEKGSLSEQQQLLRVLGKMPVEKSGGILEDVIDRVINKKLSGGIILELLEAVDSTHSEKLATKASSLRANDKEKYAGTLEGGNQWEGRGYFYYNSAAQCIRCHSIKGDGGKVGPSLTEIGKTLSRQQILESIVDPSARLSPGFGTVKITLTDGNEVTGILMEENGKQLILKTSDAEPLEVELSRISKRQNFPSGMPAMGSVMSKKEIRDMVEFLANLK